MPYIVDTKRERLYKSLNDLIDVLEEEDFDEGELNYVYFVIHKAAYDAKPKYATINKVVGAMVCSTLEQYRRIAASHEDEAINKNGDIV